MTPAVYARPRRELLSIRIVQVVHAIDDGSTAEARALAKSVVARLLDSGNPRPAGQGTGRQRAGSTTSSMQKSSVPFSTR
jgi:hypothetical protein